MQGPTHQQGPNPLDFSLRSQRWLASKDWSRRNFSVGGPFFGLPQLRRERLPQLVALRSDGSKPGSRFHVYGFYAQRSADNLDHDDNFADLLGMVIVAVPYPSEGMIHPEARGGTPYDPSTFAGPKGDLLPTAEDLAVARPRGHRRVAELAKKIRG